MGGIMRAADPAHEVSALVAALADAFASARADARAICAHPRSGTQTPAGSFPACQNTSIGIPPRG